MVKVDLITGFLGSGKTTFIRMYVQYLLEKGEKVCILENDYGAINVDMMLLSDLKSDKLGIEMVAGGCDYDCHRRRFKTKLITMAMLGYNRVIIEPSGIFDVDEFYDILHEDPLYDRYEIANVLSIVNANLEENLSKEAQYLLASQCATAGRIILSRTQEVDKEKIMDTVNRINSYLEAIRCKRRFDISENVSAEKWKNYKKQNFQEVENSGYKEISFVKSFNMDENSFQSLFFMNISIENGQVLENIEAIWKDKTMGNVLRIKGFLPEEDHWIEINSTKEKTMVKKLDQGQKIIIIIGENMDEIHLSEYFPSEYSTIHTS
ncbi:MAG: GTPase (G3E family) [Firmicutes bacterium]|nr:GTPase (G3E family) [Bacillota bacterium]